MASRIAPSKTFTQTKDVYWNDDFSGGLNLPGSGTDVFSNQGTEYLNGEFKYDNWFSKRGGFEEVKLCEGADPLANGKRLVGVYNDLPDEHTSKDGWKIRPYEFIILDSTDSASGVITRELWYYKKILKTYQKCTFAPIKAHYDTEKYGYDYREIITKDYSNVLDDDIFSHIESRDFGWYKLAVSSGAVDLKWSYLPAFKNHTNRIDYKFFTNKDDVYLKISNEDLRTNNEAYLLKLKDFSSGLFEAVIPYYTTVKEEEVIGWNISLAFWKYLPNANHNHFKAFLKWGDSNQTLTPIANIMNSNFSFHPDDYKKTQNSSIRGYRTTYKGAMPGNKVMNSYNIKSSDDLVYEWWDTIEDNRVAMAPLNTVAVKGDLEQSVKTSNHIAITSYYPVNNYYNTVDGKERKLSRDDFYNKFLAGKPGVSYGSSVNPYSRWYGYAYYWSTLAGKNISASSSGDIKDKLRWDQNTQNKYNSWYTPRKEYPQKYTNAYKNEATRALSNQITAQYTYADYANFSIYDLLTPVRMAGIIQLNNVYGTKRGAEIVFTDDADLFKAQHVSLGINDEAYVDQISLENIMDTSNVFNYKNSIGFITKSRLFFSMPQEPSMVPHNWDYTPPLSEQDKLQGVGNLYNKLVLFSKNKIFSFTGNSPSIASKDRMILNNLNPSLGAFARHTITPISQAIVFLSKSGVRKLLTTFASPDLINTKIIDGAISPLTGSLLEVDEDAIGAYFDNQYYLFLPSQNSIFVCNIDKTNLSKGAWTQWKTPLIDMKNIDKFFYGFWPSNRSQELLLGIGGKLYLKSEDQWYDGSPKATDKEKENGLYDVIFKSQELDLGKALHKKKFKAVHILAYVPDKKGAQLYVDVNVGGFQALSSNKEVQEEVDGIITTVLKPFPNLDYDAGSWNNVEGAYDVSKTGFDETPKERIPISGKGETIQVKLRNRSPKEIVIKTIGITFKYKGSK